VGWFGYRGVERTLAVELKKLEVGSAERREARDEEELQRRRQLYHRFLNDERAFMTLDEGADDLKGMEKWVYSMYDPVNDIMLTAPLEVAEAARLLHQNLVEVNKGPRPSGRSRPRRPRPLSSHLSISGFPCAAN
jgi:hypothetical protein